MRARRGSEEEAEEDEARRWSVGARGGGGALALNTSRSPLPYRAHVTCHKRTAKFELPLWITRRCSRSLARRLSRESAIWRSRDTRWRSWHHSPGTLRSRACAMVEPAQFLRVTTTTEFIRHVRERIAKRSNGAHFRTAALPRSASRARALTFSSVRLFSSRSSHRPATGLPSPPRLKCTDLPITLVLFWQRRLRLRPPRPPLPTPAPAPRVRLLLLLPSARCCAMPFSPCSMRVGCASPCRRRSWPVSTPWPRATRRPCRWPTTVRRRWCSSA